MISSAPRPSFSPSGCWARRPSWPTATACLFSCEPYGGGLRTPEMLPPVDQPMDEFWNAPAGQRVSLPAVYAGKSFVGAEAFTCVPEFPDAKWTAVPTDVYPPGPCVVRPRDQHVLLPLLRASAVPRFYPAGHVDGPMGHAARPHADVVEAVAAVFRLPCPLPVSAPARRPRGGRARHAALPRVGVSQGPYGPRRPRVHSRRQLVRVDSVDPGPLDATGRRPATQGNLSPTARLSLGRDRTTPRAWKAIRRRPRKSEPLPPNSGATATGRKSAATGTARAWCSGTRIRPT